ADATGLDYYNARYYDPVVGRFISADTVQGNMAGMDPYDYVGGNPETFTDPTGNFKGVYYGGGSDIAPPPTPPGVEAGPEGGSGDSPAAPPEPNVLSDPTATSGNTTYTFDPTTGNLEVQTTMNDGSVLWVGYMPGDSGYEDVFHRFSDLMDANDKHLGVNSVMLGHTTTSPQDPPPTKPGGSGQQPPSGGKPPTAPGGACSFTPDTQVTTDHGQQAIGSLHEGDKVQAYNPKTGKMESEPVLHVWKNTDHDLVDLTITTTKQAANGKTAQKSEVLHTTSEHPFLTTEQGFVPAGSLHKGMHIMRADGGIGTVTDAKVVPGTKVMYNLEVAQDHTFTVGDGQWVVHNQCSSQDHSDLRRNLRPDIRWYQQAHHKIPCELRDHGLVSQAGYSGNKFNSAKNGIGLPTNAFHSARDNLPQHLGSHPRYNSAVESMLDNALDDLWETFGTTADIPEGVAANVLENIMDDIGLSIQRAGGGCTIEDVFG
ncbi:MAG TPA: polymorphic toxin-type HINT domain-containing protein, partial [Ktedonobacteraceae bacterium]|nr:polymorphic toxin-type HINT domain-containing protein [Ktedonobacteraceae bacterium]